MASEVMRQNEITKGVSVGGEEDQGLSLLTQQVLNKNLLREWMFEQNL